MEEIQYIKITNKAKTELLKELLTHNFFFANEVLVSDDMLPHVCGSWLLIVILKFNSEAVADLNRILAECEAKYAGELKAQIYQAIAPIARFSKGLIIFNMLRQRLKGWHSTLWI